VTPTSALRPHGHCEEKGERDDGHQASHTNPIISLLVRKNCQFLHLRFERAAACRLPDVYAGIQRQIVG
jgi:hypothetical protein